MARTPSLQAHASVLAAALELFCERGIDTTSMDAIAEKSGVSKATIYKHWADKAALCLDVLARSARSGRPARVRLRRYPRGSRSGARLSAFRESLASNRIE